MNTTLENANGQEFEVELYFSKEFRSHGHWTIKCEVTFKGEKKPFKEVITDSQFIDYLSDLASNDASWEEIQTAYKERVFYSLQEIIIEWCEQVTEQA
jgi:hypothetical protein